MGTPLDKLTVRGFKSIRELNDFALHNLNVLVGGNGAGKSNFIEFFRVISAMMKQDGLKEYIAGNADAFLFGGPKQTANIVVKMAFGKNGYDFELAPTQDGFFLINNEQRHWVPDDELRPELPQRATRNLGSGNFNPGLLQDKDAPGRRTPDSASWFAYNAICSWQVYQFHDTSRTSGMRRYHDKNHTEMLFEDAANIAPYLCGLQTKHPDVYNEIVTAVRLVIPFFDDFVFAPNAHENLRLDWRQKGLRDYPMRPTQFSDGSIRFICLATALLQPMLPSTIIIDEPELGLHPEAIRILGELIEDCAKRTQVIVATQSPLLLDQFSIDDIVVVNRKEGQSTFERLKRADFTEWLEAYSVGELWSKNVIAGGGN
jgi:predicted ATPase